MSLTAQLTQSTLAWDFQSSNVDYMAGLSPSYSTVNGALTNLPTFVSGKYKQAIRLTQTAPNAGANTYVLWSLASRPISIDTTGITIACWVNWTTLSGSFVSMYDAFSNVLGIYMSSTQTYTGRGFSGTQALVNATSNTSTNSTGVWYHVALTYNSTSVILYKNGVGATPVSTGASGVTITGIRIGSQGNNINPTYVGYSCSDCAIDDLRIYNTALTAAQVQTIYRQQGMPGRSVISNSIGSVKTSLTGTPLFTQLSTSAAASSVGAFSLRAVNGPSAKAVQVTQYTLLTVPPVALTQNTFTATGTFNGVTNGQYVARCSTYNATSDAYRVFDQNTGTRGTTSGTEYTVGTGAYIGTDSTVDSTSTTYNGAWFQIRIPSAVNAVSYSVSVHSSYTLTAPYTWKLFGSTTGSSGSWVVLDTQTTYTFTSGTVNFPLSQLSAGYTYFRLAANRISPSSTTGDLGPAELIIYGYSSLVSSTQDFYADRLGDLRTVPVTGQTLASWLGGATGYVTTWYDQSGAGNHMSCSSAGIQPKIDLVNNFIDLKPSAYFDVSAGTTGPVPFQSSKNYTVVFRHGQFVGSGLFCATQNAAGPYGNLVNNFKKGTGSTYTQYWYGNDVNNKGVLATGNRVSYKWDGTNRSLYVNGTLADATASSGWAQTASSIQMIGKTNFDAAMNGELYGAFMFTTALSDTDRALLENFL